MLVGVVLAGREDKAPTRHLPASHPPSPPSRGQVGIEDAIHTALLTLKEGFEGQMAGNNIEVRRCRAGWGRGGRGAGARACFIAAARWRPRCTRLQARCRDGARPPNSPNPTPRQLAPSPGRHHTRTRTHAHTCPPTLQSRQVGIIGPDKMFKVLTAAEVEDYLQEVE